MVSLRTPCPRVPYVYDFLRILDATVKEESDEPLLAVCVQDPCAGCSALLTFIQAPMSIGWHKPLSCNRRTRRREERGKTLLPRSPASRLIAKAASKTMRPLCNLTPVLLIQSSSARTKAAVRGLAGESSHPRRMSLAYRMHHPQAPSNPLRAQRVKAPLESVYSWCTSQKLARHSQGTVVSSCHGMSRTCFSYLTQI